MLGDRYQIGELLGEGGMGTVYKGYDPITKQTVAIKVLKSELANDDMLKRFSREGDALRQLNHPNIVKLLDTIQSPERNALVIEYVAGGSLKDLLQEQEMLSIEAIIEIALDLADALTRAHRLHIIHRDIKPENILLAEDGTPRLTDFGIASVIGSNITQSGIIIGTIAYLSPEMLQGEEASSLSDIWAFGVTLYEMLSGHRPFQGDEIYKLLITIVNDQPEDLESLRPDAPIALVDLVNRMLAKNPAERIPSIRLVGAELESLLLNNEFVASRGIIASDLLSDNVFAITPASHEKTKHNLPNQSTAFVGREAELQSLQGLLENPKLSLVTIVAQGGMGKTRLSIEAARSQLNNYPQGVYFIELAPLDTADSIPMAVAEAVGYPFQDDDRSPRQQIMDYFSEKEQFLVFDNFEHIITGRSFIQDILKTAPKIKILCTSRERLNLTGETVFQLEGMDFPEWETPEDALDYAALRLFMESVYRLRPDFELSKDDLPYAARICRLVEGLPLALVLAGTWVELLSLQEIVVEISNNIDFLESTLHDIPERQRSMRAVFEYSWQLLSDAEQETLAQLALFRGGFTREAAQSVASANLRILQTLVNKSILHRNNETGRYEIHELLRQYLQEQLIQADLLALVQEKHALYFASYVAARHADVKGRRQIPALHEIEADFENIKTAWRIACEREISSVIADMLEVIYWFGLFRSRNTEGLELFRMARQIWQAHDVNASLLAGRLAVHYPESPENPASLYELGLAIATKHNDSYSIAFCKRQLGHWRSHSELNQEIGIPLLQGSLEEYRSLNEQFCAAMILDDLGWSYNLNGERIESIELVEESLAIRRQIGDKIGVANALRNLGGAHGGFGSGHMQPMIDWQEALELAREIGDKNSIAWNNALLAAFWMFRGEFEKARSYYQEAIQIASDINEQVIRGFCILLEALESIIVDADYENAERLTNETLAPDVSFDVRRLLWIINTILVIFAKEDFDHLADSPIIKLDLDIKHPLMAIFILLGIGKYIKEGQYEKATELLGMVILKPLSLYELIQDWSYLKQAEVRLKQALGAELFDRYLENGKTLELYTVTKQIKKEISA